MADSKKIYIADDDDNIRGAIRATTLSASLFRAAARVVRASVDSAW